MNILAVAHYQNDGSPTAIFVHDQVLAYRRLGHSVRVIVPIVFGKRDMNGRRQGTGVRREDIDGIPHYFIRHLSLSKYGKRRFNTAAALYALRAGLGVILDGFVPDVIHAHTLGFDSEIGAWLKERVSVPLVVTSHGSDASIPIEQGRGAQLRHYCDKADTIVAVSSVLARKIRSCGTAVSVFSIINGFRIRNLPEGEMSRTVTLAQVGTLDRQKRPHITLHAFARLLETHPGMVLTFIGQGPEQSSLETMSRELGISKSVRFLGQLSNDEVLTELAKTQFFVLPSVREGFGIVYLEAMASGCVTVGTEGEGITDVIVSGENGFLVPPDDSEAIVRVIEWCLDHPDEAAAIAERGRKAAMGLTWEKNAAEYIELFEGMRKDGTQTG